MSDSAELAERFANVDRNRARLVEALAQENSRERMMRAEKPVSEPDDVTRAAIQILRAEFGDPFTIWGREGEWAWELMVQNFAHIGWGPLTRNLALLPTAREMRTPMTDHRATLDRDALTEVVAPRRKIDHDNSCAKQYGFSFCDCEVLFG